MRVFSAAEVAHEAALEADRHEGPVAEMLAYCAEMLDTQERAALRRHHFARVPLKQLEREAVARALHEARGHQAKAAELLGISPATMSRRVQRFGLNGHAPVERVC